MKRKIISVLLCVLLLASLLPVSAFADTTDSGTCGDNLTWTLDSEGTLTISGTGEMEDWGWGEAPWNSKADSIVNVVIGNDVTSIGSYAFYSCSSLTSVTIPDNVTNIGEYAFCYCENLESVSLSSNLKAIEEGTFNGCDNLKSVTIPDSVTSIGNSAFYSCSSLTSVTIPNSVTSIGDNAFQGCDSLTSVTIPNSVTSIGDSAFEDCSSLTDVAIGNGVTSIGDNAFAECGSLSTVNYGGTKAQWAGISIADGNGYLTEADIICTDTVTWTLDDGVLTISGEGPMEDYTENNGPSWRSESIEKVVIEEGVTSVGDYAFAWCYHLTDVTIGNGVTSIGNSAFEDCNLTNVTIGNGVTSIGNSAFEDCNSLTNVTIGKGVTSIGENAFEYCGSLSTVNYGGTTTQWAGISIADGNGYLTMTDIICTDGKLIPHGSCGDNVTWVLDNGVLTISGTGAMYDYSDVSDYINDNAASWSIKGDSIEEVVIEEGVTSIGDYAFSSCLGLANVTIGNGVTSVGDYAFAWCYDLTDIAFVGTKEAWASITKGTNAIPKSIRMHYDCPSLDNHIIAMERKDPSCTSAGYIKYGCSCGYEFTETLPQNHDYVFTEAVATDCSSVGYDEYKCSKCGDVKKEYYEEKLLAHDYELTKAVEPTCTEHGYDVYKCTMCGTSKTETRDDELLPHDYVATVTESTCLKGGYTTYTCSECGDSYVDSYTDALDHDYGEWTQTKAPTCTEQGTETRTCSRCSASETRDVDALGHTLVHHEGKAATCTEKGWAAYDTCNHCDYTTYKEIPATGHNYIAKVFAPTCTVKGYTTYTCSDCGDSYIDDYVDSLGHDRIHHEAKAATCTEIGWEAYDTCSRCDYTTYKEIPALGHDIVHHDAKAVTCTENGWAAFDTCSRCDYTTYEEIAAPGHSYQAKVFAPTCTVKGYTAYTCTVCGDSYKDNYTDALGHDRIHHEEKAATCAENGWEAFDTCSRCDYTTYEEIAALGHDYKNGSCTRCGADDPDYVEAPVIKITTSAGKPKISWNKVDGAAKYKVFYSTDGKKYYQLIETTKTSVTHTKAKIGTTYYYKVKAVNSNGTESVYSNAKSIKCVPAAPTVSISRSGGKAKLSWKAVSGATKYWIYRSTDGKTFKYYTSTTKLTYTDSNSKSGTKYYYKVRAIAVVNNTNVGSAYSTVKTITTTLAKPTVKITTSNGKPKLSWSKVTGADKYYIYRSTDGKTFSYLTYTTKLTYTNTGAKKNTKYYYKVKAICSSSTAANSAYSAVVSVKATK